MSFGSLNSRDPIPPAFPVYGIQCFLPASYRALPLSLPVDLRNKAIDYFTTLRCTTAALRLFISSFLGLMYQTEMEKSANNLGLSIFFTTKEGRAGEFVIVRNSNHWKPVPRTPSPRRAHTLFCPIEWAPSDTGAGGAQTNKILITSSINSHSNHLGQCIGVRSVGNAAATAAILHHGRLREGFNSTR